MRRRAFIAALGGAAAWPLAARAEQLASRPRIGVLWLWAEGDPEAQHRLTIVRNTLDDLGLGNAQLEVIWASGDVDRVNAGAVDLVSRKVDVILTFGMEPTMAARQATRATPIVFVSVSDPIAAGFVDSLREPAGNITGFASYEPSEAGKWLQLLNEAAPHVTRVLFIYEPEHPVWQAYFQAAEAVAKPSGIRLTPAGIREPNEITAAFEQFAAEPNGGVLVVPGLGSGANSPLIVKLAAELHLPAIYCYRFFTTIGGLMSYSLDGGALTRQSVSYVARILEGEKPGNLPIQQPTKFELVINLKTAKALGLEIPPKLLALADEIIE